MLNLKVDIKECVNYALENNISVKQTELDIKSSSIDKKAAIGNFLPSLNANASHSWNIGLNQDITILVNKKQRSLHQGASIGIDIYKGLQNQNTLRRANLSIVAAKYQLLKMQEDIALNVANAFLQVLLIRKT
jgi:outer membrane protein